MTAEDPDDSGPVEHDSGLVPCLFGSIALHAIGVLVGFLVPPPATAAEPSGPAMAQGRVSVFELALHNARVALLLAAGGLLVGLLTLLNLLFNGILLGSLVGRLLDAGVSGPGIIALIIPHGILELPALWLAGAAGFVLPYQLVRYLRGRKRRPLTGPDVIRLGRLVAIVLSLIVGAAWVETTVTPSLVRAVGVDPS